MHFIDSPASVVAIVLRAVGWANTWARPVVLFINDLTHVMTWGWEVDFEGFERIHRRVWRPCRSRKRWTKEFGWVRRAVRRDS